MHDYVLVRTDGSALSKAQILEDLEIHLMTFKKVELASELVHIHGSVGILMGVRREFPHRSWTRKRFRGSASLFITSSGGRHSPLSCLFDSNDGFHRARLPPVPAGLAFMFLSIQFFIPRESNRRALS